MAVIPKKVDVFGVGVSVVDYAAATNAIITAAKEKRSFGATALAVHGLVTSVTHPDLLGMVNAFDLVCPDGQPVRWAMNTFHQTHLSDRVYGPALGLSVCRQAAAEGIGVYLFGSTPKTCAAMIQQLKRRFPSLKICGAQPDWFRDVTPQEDEDDVRRINDSGAGIVMVGCGCPRQEIWVAKHRGRIHGAMLAIGAAFDFWAGTKPQAPGWMQRSGLEWLFRLACEPRRLWARYLTTNSLYCLLFIRVFVQRNVLGIKRDHTHVPDATTHCGPNQIGHRL